MTITVVNWQFLPAKENIIMTDYANVETAAVEEYTGKRRGPKANPFLRLEKAQARAEKARNAYAKVQKVADALAAAEAEEQEALAALQEAVAAAGVNSD